MNVQRLVGVGAALGFVACGPAVGSLKELQNPDACPAGSTFEGSAHASSDDTGYAVRCNPVPNICKWGGKVITRSAVICDDPPSNGSEDDRDQIARLNEKLAEFAAASEAGNQAQANEVAGEVDVAAFRYGLDNWFEIVLEMELDAAATRSLGLAYTIAHAFPAATEAHSIGVRFAGAYGWGTADGGYYGPDGALLMRQTFNRSVFFLESTLDVRLSLSRRWQLILDAGLRAGVQDLSGVHDESLGVGNLFWGVPATAGFSVRALPWAALGASFGTLLDFKRLSPNFSYTGAGANVIEPSGEFKAILIGGVHASLGW